jgi:hypothetical protein
VASTGRAQGVVTAFDIGQDSRQRPATFAAIIEKFRTKELRTIVDRYVSLCNN